jgi:HEAT repeats
MKRSMWVSLGIAFLLLARLAEAQSLSRRIHDVSDGTVEFTFASRPGACGDGATYVRDPLGDDESRIYEGGNFSGHTRGDDWPPCIRGPVRVVATIGSAEVIRLRTYVGPRPERLVENHRDLGTVSIGEAVGFLTDLVGQAHGRSANDAILPFILADSITPWPTLLRFARDQQLSRSVRSTVAFWLARGAAVSLGVRSHDDDPDDEVRGSAVFALSQQPKEVAIPQLIEVARHNTHPAARAQALFWLGQSGDPRAIDLFEEMLDGVRDGVRGRR